MGRSWQFFLTVAIVIGVMGYLYYTSDFYAERSAGPDVTPATEAGSPGQEPAAAEGGPAKSGGIPSKE